MREVETADITVRAGRSALSSDARCKSAVGRRSSFRILLVHGFNVDEDEAVEALNGFRKGLAHFSRTIAAHAFTFTWPGDWPLPIVRPAGYPMLVDNAVSSARVLMKDINTSRA